MGVKSMKVRVIQEPDGYGWTVETREWWFWLFPVWGHQRRFSVSGYPSEFILEQQLAEAKQRAIDYATILANPEIVYIE